MTIGNISANNAAFDQALFMAKNHSFDKAQNNLKDADRQKIEQTAQEFEAVFLSEMMSHVFDKIEVDGMFGGGSGEEMYRSMMTKEYGKQMAAKGGIGLAKHVTEHMIRLQEAQQQ